MLQSSPKTDRYRINSSKQTYSDVKLRVIPRACCLGQCLGANLQQVAHYLRFIQYKNISICSGERKMDVKSLQLSPFLWKLFLDNLYSGSTTERIQAGTSIGWRPDSRSGIRVASTHSQFISYLYYININKAGIYVCIQACICIQ